MMFEAILFLAGAVLFLLAVLFFVFLWQDRTAIVRQGEALKNETQVLKEQRVDLEIREHELTVWSQGLEHQQIALEQAREELRMLTASKQVPAHPPLPEREGAPQERGEGARRRTNGETPVIKNTKGSVKLGARD